MKEILKKYISYYFTFSGRITRRQYLFDLIMLFLGTAAFAILSGIVVLAGSWLVAELLTIADPVVFARTIVKYYAQFIGYAASIAWAAIAIRRAHDFNASFFLVLLPYVCKATDLLLLRQIPQTAAEYSMFASVHLAIELIQLSIFIALLFWPGTKSSNKFGENPRNSKVKSEASNNL